MKEKHSGDRAVENLFTQTADDYARLFRERRTGKSHAFRERLQIAIELSRTSSGRLLDCAIGSGEITAAILAEGNYQFASLVDVSPKMIKLSRSCIQERVPFVQKMTIDFVCDDIFQVMSFLKTESFDLILCLGLIAHTGRLPELLGGMRRLLSPNGAILLQTTLASHLGTKVERRVSSERYFRRAGYRISYFNHRDIQDACAAAELAVCSCRRHSLGIPFGDKFWPWGNYQLERLLMPITKVYGSEALYLLKRSQDA